MRGQIRKRGKTYSVVVYNGKDAKGKKVASAKTDNFGDFWFERQEPGKYSLVIEKTGYLPRKVEAFDCTKDINLGDYELSKKAG